MFGAQVTKLKNVTRQLTLKGELAFVLCTWI